MIGWLFGKRLASIDLAHRDLSRREQRPEQHRGGFGAGQNSLRLDAPLEFRVQALNGVRRADRSPLAWREAREGEEALST